MREADVRSVKRFFERVCAELDVFSPGVLSSKYGLAISSSYRYLAVASKLGIIERVRHGLYRCRDSGARPSEAAATPVARVDGDRLVLELRLEAVESLRESIERKLQVLEASIRQLQTIEAIEKRLEALEQRLYGIEQKLGALASYLSYLNIDLELSTRPSDEELEQRIVEIIDQKRLAYYHEVLEELRLRSISISYEHLARLLRRLVEKNKIVEIAQRLFTSPELADEITVDEIKQKYESLGLSKIPPPLTTTKTIYRAMKHNAKIIVLPNR